MQQHLCTLGLSLYMVIYTLCGWDPDLTEATGIAVCISLLPSLYLQLQPNSLLSPELLQGLHLFPHQVMLGHLHGSAYCWAASTSYLMKFRLALHTFQDKNSQTNLGFIPKNTRQCTLSRGWCTSLPALQFFFSSKVNGKEKTLSVFLL